MRDLTDGTSNIFVIGEAWGGARAKTSHAYGPWGMSGIHTSIHGRVVSASVSSTTACNDPSKVDCYTPYAAQWGVNSDYNGDGSNRTYAWAYGSGHTGGAQFLFGDGTVHFLSENIDYKTLCNLSYIHDGQTLGEF